MEVLFIRTGPRRYAVQIRRADDDVLRMDPAPGFDEHFPHDMQHLIVEEQLGLRSGIFGRLANGGTSATFAPVSTGGSVAKRDAARRRRKLERRERRLTEIEPPQFGESERATYVVWHDWLSRCPEPALRRRGASMAETAAATRARMDPAERSRLDNALPRIRIRIDEVARRWNRLENGEWMSVIWNPIDT